MPVRSEIRKGARPVTAERALTSSQLRRTGGARFPLVDSLRAIAALSVFVYHLGVVARPPHAIAIFTSQLSLGVTLFFVISGFLLYRPFVAARFIRGRRPLGTGRYAWHRFLRIVPAYWVALTVVALWSDKHAVFGSDAIVYYGFGQDYSFRTQLGGIGAAWTLSIEVAFYVFLPFWAWAIARIPAATARRRLRVELIALALLAAFSLVYKPVIHGATGLSPNLWFALVNALPTYLDQFAIGMALAVASVWFEIHRPPRAVKVIDDHSWLPWGVAAIALSVLATQFGAHYSELGGLEIHYLDALVALGLFLPAVFGTLGRGSVRQLLGNPVLIWIGVVSYGLYLWHLAVITQVLKWGIPQAVGIGTGIWGLFVWGLVCIIPALAFAAASWYAIERPAMRQKNKRPPIWVRRLMRVGRSGVANPARLSALTLGGFLVWVVASNVLGSPSGPSAQVRRTLASNPSGRGWTYIVATYDSRALRLYQDARLIASTPASGTPGPTSAGIEVGNFIGGARWTGLLKYVAVYRFALTTKQIQTHYDAGLFGWWLFENELKVAPTPVYLWRNRLPAGGLPDPAHPHPSRSFSIEAWVVPYDTDNRVVVAQPYAWILQTDLLGHWRAGLFVHRRESDAKSQVVPTSP
jgi:peptidoglycan/LPS O-acetylase OafA/YrhL